MPHDYSRSSAAAEAQLAERLRNSGIPFIQDFAVGGVEVDFAFTFGDRRLILAELKAWDPTPENVDRAAAQAQLYAERTNATNVYIVIPHLRVSDIPRGVVNGTTLVSILLKDLEALKSKTGRVLHVKPADGRWSVVVAGSRLPHAFATQADAISAGRALARGQRSEVVIHARSGRIVGKDSFGSDPVPPRDAGRVEPSRGVRRRASKALKKPASKRARPTPAQPSPQLTLFAAMPFAPEYDDVFMSPWPERRPSYQASAIVSITRPIPETSSTELRP